ncbi:MAG: beta-N-acetylhexosaminidase [Bryobacteraceae bacterium]
MLLVLAPCLAPAQSGLGLMPLPEKVTLGQGRLIVGADFNFRLAGYTDARLEAAVARLRQRLARQTGLPLLADTTGGAVLAVDCRGAGPANPTLGEDESYVLDVTPGGARLLAPAVTGALRGMATFAQLIAANGESFYAPAVHIEDRPRFAWRGLMLDCGRHWMPVAVVERNLEAMAAVKLNVFHWHLTEDQGFRVESKRFPLLQEKGSDGQYYTQQDIRHVVSFARDRGIRVVPEFDMPGHSTSWFVGYPELASAPGPYSIERYFGIFDPAMDPSQEKVYAFLDALMGEMAGLFPDPYVHIGGDEVRETQWKANPAIQAFAARHGFSTSPELQAYFNKRVQELLQRHGKKLMGWEEVLNPDLPTDTVVQSWRGQEALAEAVKKGFFGILSFDYYLNYGKPASFHYRNDPLGGKASDLGQMERARVLGGEACMWTEFTSAQTVDSRIWPREAAIAERLWSPADVTDVDSMYARLDVVSRGLEWTGVQHRSYERSALDRFAGGPAREALQVLADALEVNRIDLLRKQKFTTRSPRNQLLDAIPPESILVRHVETAIRNLSAPRPSPRDADYVRTVLVAWRDNHARLLPTLESNFLLKETVALSENLSKAGEIGLEALGYLEKNEAPPAGWRERQRAALAELDRPYAEMTLGASRAVRALLERAANPAVPTR